MKIIIYPGSEANIEHFRDFSLTNQISFSVDCDEVGRLVRFDADFDYTDELTLCILGFITEMYLENYILCKIYDEYPCIDIMDTSDILNDYVRNFSNSHIGHKVEELIDTSGKFNLPSFVLFNIKQIMLTTNELVDSLCQKLLSTKKHDYIIELINSYNTVFSDDFFKKNNENNINIMDEKKQSEEHLVDIKLRD